MHDPMCVAFDVKIPIPKRSTIGGTTKRSTWQWGIRRRRFTNEEHLGQAIGHWWMPGNWIVRVGGKALRWRTICTVWHYEPGGADSGKVCSHRRQKRDGTWKYSNRWRWHVHHWKIRFPLWQKARRFLFERCGRCGRGYPWGYAPTRFMSSDDTFHSDCMSLGYVENELAGLKEVTARVTRRLIAHLDWSEQDLIAALHQRPDANNPSSPMQRMDQHVIPQLLGWKFDHHADDGYNLEKIETAQRFAPHSHPLAPTPSDRTRR